MMPGSWPFVLGLQQQHVAVVAGGDDLVLQQPLGVAAAQVALHDARELRPQAQQRAAEVGEPRRGVVGHLARGQERPADRHRHVARVLDLGRQAGEPRGAFDPGHAPGDLDAAFDERGQVGERAGLEVGPADPGARQGLARVGEVVVGLAADARGGAPPPRWSGPGLPDAGRLGERPEPFQASPPRG